MDLFYESLCPYSMSFISRKVGPMHEAIGQDVRVNFVPYGNAQTQEVEGGYEFECQHGPAECYGNQVQACAIAHAPDYDTTVRLIVCMMSSSDPSTAGPECFQEFGLDYQPIQDCLDSGEGAELHASHGRYQSSQVPAPNYVPWANFNGEHVPGQIEDDMDLVAYICENFDVPSCQ